MSSQYKKRRTQRIFILIKDIDWDRHSEWRYECSGNIWFNDRDWQKHYGFTGGFTDDQDLFYQEFSAEKYQPPILRVKDVLRRKTLIHDSQLENLSSIRVISLIGSQPRN